jgi:hypothetical protein
MAEAKCVLWLTGASGSVDAMLARRVEAESKAKGYSVGVLDAAGANSRPRGEFDGTAVESGDTPLANDIDELLARNSLVVVNAQSPPPLAAREEVGRRACMLIEVRARDYSGERESGDAGGPARASETMPDVITLNDTDTAEEVVQKVIARLQAASAHEVAVPAQDGYNAEEEEEIRRRLEDLGYI